MKVGLTLGKFAPFHKGHQLLVERALSETDQVLVMVYDAPNVTICPLPVRAGWIRQLYPQVEVIEAWDGPSEITREPEGMRRHEEYILSKLGSRQVTHFYSSEFYGDHVSKALGAQNCQVDPERNTVPVSGTAIRSDPFTHRGYLDPAVYRDLVTKVVFLGAPSTGKTTLAQSLATKFNTVWMPEYGRQYWEQHQEERRLTPEQLIEIAEGHIKREDSLMLGANRYLFVDTDATTTAMFSLYYHGQVHPRLVALAEKTRERYDLFVLCEDDIPYDNTWDRSGEMNRAVFQEQIRADLFMRRIPYIRATGSLDKRIAQVERILHGFDKFVGIGGCVS
ncbi:MAG: AAA family ATPase [Candidatus Omnitrophica bacterium]|nr:AAA family ATPase [Candidatus Omnitrophota bacterium]